MSAPSCSRCQGSARSWRSRPQSPARLAGVLRLDEVFREAALRHLDLRATNALGARLDARTWTVGASGCRRGAARGGRHPTEVAQAVVNRLPQVGAGTKSSANSSTGSTSAGSWARRCSAPRASSRRSPRSSNPEVLSEWLVKRCRSLRSSWGPWNQPRRLLATEAKGRAVGLVNDIRPLLLALGTLAAPGRRMPLRCLPSWLRLRDRGGLLHGRRSEARRRLVAIPAAHLPMGPCHVARRPT